MCMCLSVSTVSACFLYYACMCFLFTFVPPVFSFCVWFLAVIVLCNIFICVSCVFFLQGDAVFLVYICLHSIFVFAIYVSHSYASPVCICRISCVHLWLWMCLLSVSVPHVFIRVSCLCLMFTSNCFPCLSFLSSGLLAVSSVSLA